MKNTSFKYTGYLAGIIGVVMFSAKAVMVKYAYQYDVDAVSLLLLRMLFALPFYLVMLLVEFRDFKSKLDFKIIRAITLFGFLGYYLASYFDFLGLEYIKASLERIILFVYPTLVLLLSRVFLKTKITKRQIWAILITYAGVTFIFVQDQQLMNGTEVGLGAMLIFLSALTYASYLVGSGYLIPKIGSSAFTSLAMLVSCICVILHFLIVSEVDLFSFSAEVYGLSLAMAVISTVLPSYLVSYAIKSIGAPNFSILGSLGPVSTIILAFVFLGEQFTLLQSVGVIVVMIGVYFVSKK